MKNIGYLIVLVFLLVILLIGCGNKSRPTIKDPCASAPTECWGDKGVDPNTIPSCVQVIQCGEWEILSK